MPVAWPDGPHDVPGLADRLLGPDQGAPGLGYDRVLYVEVGPLDRARGKGDLRPCGDHGRMELELRRRVDLDFERAQRAELAGQLVNDNPP